MDHFDVIIARFVIFLFSELNCDILDWENNHQNEKKYM